MRSLDRHLERVAQFGGAADMVDMAMGQPDFLDGHRGLLDRIQDLRTSPPGSMTTAFLVASHQMMVQFCSNSVTGTMIAPAFALVSVSSFLGHGLKHADFLHCAK